METPLTLGKDITNAIRGYAGKELEKEKRKLYSVDVRVGGKIVSVVDTVASSDAEAGYLALQQVTFKFHKQNIKK